MAARNAVFVWLFVCLFALSACRTVPEGGAGGLEPLVVPLEVVRRPGGDTIAFVSVFIGDEGPFPFVVDTGASRTTLNEDLLDALGIATLGVGQALGIGGAVETSLARLEDWRIGDVPLERIDAALVEFPEVPGVAMPAGLFGSDVLARFDVIAIDYRRGRLLLSPPHGGGHGAVTAPRR